MKRIFYKEISLVLAMSLFFSCLIFAGPNENAGIRFDLNATTYGNQNDTIMTIQSVGDYIRLDVYAINVNNFDTYEFEVNYNSSQLDYITATPTNPITYEPNILTTNGGTALGWMIDTSTPGVLSIAYTLAGTDTLEAPEGEGLIADIVFQVSSTVGDSLTFGDVLFYDSFGVMDIVTDKGIAIILGAVSIDDAIPIMDSSIKLHQNYPNPFSGSTTFSFSITNKALKEVAIKIFDIRGGLVKEALINNNQNLVEWDGKDFSGKLVSNGVYFYQLESKNYKSEIKKMIIIR